MAKLQDAYPDSVYASLAKYLVSVNAYYRTRGVARGRERVLCMDEATFDRIMRTADFGTLLELITGEGID